jgi:hypothetical protein
MNNRTQHLAHRRPLRNLFFAGATLVALVVLTAALPNVPVPTSISVEMFQQNRYGTDDLVVTGTTFLTMAERQPDISYGGTSGPGTRVFAHIPVPAHGESGEMRCRLSPGKYGFAAGYIFCHAGNGCIYSVPPDGKHVTQFACLPSNATRPTDGALTFDDTPNGTFHHALLAASGGSGSGPGAVYALGFDARKHISVTLIGAYPGSAAGDLDSSGAENMVMAPPGFGPTRGVVLITVDNNDHDGGLLAMDGRGQVRVLVHDLPDSQNPDGLNAVVVLAAPGHGVPGVTAKPGLYLTNYQTGNTLLAPAAQFQPFLGKVLVGTEDNDGLYVVDWQRTSVPPYHLTVDASMSPTDEPYLHFEGALYVSG